MKRFFTKVISILCCVLFAFLSSSLPVFASTSYDVDDFANVIYVDNEEIVILDSKSIDNISRKMIRLSDQEKADIIFESFNIELLKATKQYNDLVNHFDDIRSINVSTAYIRVDKHGNQTIISKEECMKAVEYEKTLQKTNSTSDGWEDSETESSNGYMMQRIIAIYTGDPKGTYSVFCISKWLKTPLVRVVDAMSVSSREMKWSENVEDYSGLAVYEKTTRNHNGNNITENTEPIYIDLKKPLYYNTNKGFAYEWDLPSNTSYVSGGYGVSYSYAEFGTIIAGKCNVIDYNNHNQMISLDYRYLHVQVSVDPEKIIYDIVVENKKWYISLIDNMSLIQKNYDYSHAWDYAKHASL